MCLLHMFCFINNSADDHSLCFILSFVFCACAHTRRVHSCDHRRRTFSVVTTTAHLCLFLIRSSARPMRSLASLFVFVKVVTTTDALGIVQNWLSMPVSLGVGPSDTCVSDGVGAARSDSTELLVYCLCGQYFYHQFVIVDSLFRCTVAVLAPYWSPSVSGNPCPKTWC